MIIELFAGPGGWSEALRLIGNNKTVRAWEINSDACKTARAAGHQRYQADVTTQYPQEWNSVTGIIASPPCKDWSITGTGAGESGETGYLINEPMRWVRALRPEWTVWECTPRAARAFELHESELRAMGYKTEVAIFDAWSLGVPQQRQRVILRARLGLNIHGPKFVPKPVMADVLDLPPGTVLVSNNGTGGIAANRGRRRLDQPSFTMTGKCGRFKWEFPDGTRRNLTVAEAGVLQSFRPDYPWQGGSVSKQQQVGDAIPPRMGAALLASVGA